MAEELKQIAILRVGPLTSRPPPASTDTIGVLIEAETPDGRAHLVLSPAAVLELRKELEIWLKAHGYR
jgi:hypothetical protein